MTVIFIYDVYVCVCEYRYICIFSVLANSSDFTLRDVAGEGGQYGLGDELNEQ